MAELMNGESVRTINLLAMITSALAVIVMGLGLFLLNAVWSEVRDIRADNKTTLETITKHITSHPDRALSDRIVRLEAAIGQK